MYEILEHKKAVQDNIKKAFENNLQDIEKAKWQIGEVRVDSRGIAHECFEYVNGKPHLRRVKKNKGASTTSTVDNGGKKEVDNFMELVQKFSGKYTDESKVIVSKTPKGNWDVSYDGHRLGIINANQLSEKTAKLKGWLKEENDTQSNKKVGKDKNDIPEGWNKIKGINGDEFIKKEKSGVCMIIPQKDGLYLLNLKYNGYMNGVGDIIENLTKQEAVKIGNKFLKDPRGYFDIDKKNKGDSTESKKEDKKEESEKIDIQDYFGKRPTKGGKSGNELKLIYDTAIKAFNNSLTNKDFSESNAEKFLKDTFKSFYFDDKSVENYVLYSLDKWKKAVKKYNDKNTIAKKQDNKKKFTESSFKNSFDSIISNISSIVDKVFVEKPVGRNASTVDKTYKTSDWKKGVYVVGNDFYGKSELLQLDINKKGGNIETIQLRKPISNGIGSSYNNKQIGHVIAEVYVNDNWSNFDISKESGRKDFAELLNKNIKK